MHLFMCLLTQRWDNHLCIIDGFDKTLKDFFKLSEDQL